MTTQTQAASAPYSAPAIFLGNTARRRLAANVVCLFDEDRPPVINEKRRGRLPRSVVSFQSRPRLMPGDLAELYGDCRPENIGKPVRLLEQLPDGWYNIEAIGCLIEFGPDKQNCPQLPGRRASASGRTLRRTISIQSKGAAV